MEVDITDTFGAMFTGALVSMSIYGITTLQMYFYFMQFPKDSIGLKLSVALIWVLDTLHVIFMCHTIHYYLIKGFGKPALLANGIWSLFASLGVNIIIALVVQSYFALRIHKLCSEKKKWWVSSFIGLTVLAHFCFGMETVVFFFVKREFSRLKEVTLNSVLPFGVLAILSDIFVAGALCILLHNHRSGFKETDSLINKLIVFAINRCILTTAMAVIEVIVFAVLPDSFYTFALDFVIGKLYANSFLAALNSRVALREGARDHFEGSDDTSTGLNIASVVTDQRPNTNISLHVRSREVTASNQSTDLEKGSSLTARSDVIRSKQSYPSTSPRVSS